MTQWTEARAPTPECVRALMPQLRSELATLVAIPSVSADGYPAETRPALLEAHEAIVALLRGAGVERLSTLELPGTAPVITGEVPDATLAMPLLAPLGDFAEVGRPLVVTAWSWSAGLARFITPTSATVMAGLALAGVRYDRWIGFMLPLMALLGVASLVMLGIAALLE